MQTTCLGWTYSAVPALWCSKKSNITESNSNGSKTKRNATSTTQRNAALILLLRLLPAANPGLHSLSICNNIRVLSGPATGYSGC